MNIFWHSTAHSPDNLSREWDRQKASPPPAIRIRACQPNYTRHSTELSDLGTLFSITIWLPHTQPKILIRETLNYHQLKFMFGNSSALPSTLVSCRVDGPAHTIDACHMMGGHKDIMALMAWESLKKAFTSFEQHGVRLPPPRHSILTC